MKKYTIAVVGATGMVGRKMLQVLEEMKLPAQQYYLFASSRSAGKQVDFMGEKHTIELLCPTCLDDKKVDIAIFSAGGGTSLEFAPLFAEHGAVVIDNSSAWRMDPEVPLVVPEVNAHVLKDGIKKGIVANPNCSTIQAMVALAPLHKAYTLKRVIYSTYQAVSGSGLGGYNDLKNGIEGQPPEKYPHPIFGNILPHIDDFREDGYTKEEQKMIDETKKILEDDSIRITATTARVPVFYGHSESINLEFEKPFELEALRKVLEQAPGLVVQDAPERNEYPMPIYAQDTNEVYVGRIRRDFSVDSGVNLWVVADNIRKGAATNAVQIAQKLIEMWG